MAKPQIEYYFNRYAQNWEIIKQHINPKLQPDLTDVFLCPICFERRAYLREAIYEDLLSLEHIPPEKLGGQVRTLTCKECNNRAGTELDRHFILEQNFKEFAMGVPGSSYDAKYSFNDSPKIDATIVRPNPETWQIVGDPKRTNPRSLEEVSEIIRNVLQTEGLNVTLSFRLYKKGRPEIAHLRTAYLWAFSVYGYCFLFNENSKTICKQINNPDEDILPTLGIFPEVGFPDEALGLNIIYEPKNLRAYLVVFDIVTARNTKSRYGVILPHPYPDGLNIYQRLLDRDKTSIQLKLKTVDKDFDFIQKAPFSSLEVWRHF